MKKGGKIKEGQAVISKVDIHLQGVKQFRKGAPYKVHKRTSEGFIQLINHHQKVSHFIDENLVEPYFDML